MVKKPLNKGTALVTGGAVRVGKAIALHLADQGYDIALHYNSSATEAKKTAKEIEVRGRKCTLLKYDLADMAEVNELAKAAGKIKGWSVLVNNAAIFERRSFVNTDEDIFDRHFNINFKAAFFLSQAFAKHAKRGNIINIADTFITKNNTAFFAYMLSKKILYEFTKLAATELAPNIRVNAIAPGIVMPGGVWGVDYLTKKKHTLPLGKTASLADINKTISHIIANDFITGECFFIDGGEKLI